MPLWLTRRDVARVLTMPDAINAVESAFIRLSAGHARQPLRTNMPAADPTASDAAGSLLTMPAFLAAGADSAAPAGLGVKLITLFAGNPARRNLPAIQGNFVLFDPESGQLQAVMEAGLLTAVRTGAASGVATRHLARPNARVLTIFGTGAQAFHQVEAMCAERPIEEIRVISRRVDHARRFADEVAERLRRPATAVESAADIETDTETDAVATAIADADVIVTATSATEPLFAHANLPPGVHINGIGSHTPAAAEVPAQTVAAARVVTDQTSACLAEAGDLIRPIEAGLFSAEAIHAEIGEIAGGQRPGREAPDQITFFKSVGLAVQDVAVASLILRRARAEGIGQEVGE